MTATTPILLDLRLRILQSLAKQNDYRLADRMISYEMDAWGFRFSLDAIRTQLRVMEGLGAVKLLTDTDELVLAEITVDGRNHVKRRMGSTPLAGIRRPDPGE